MSRGDVIDYNGYDTGISQESGNFKGGGFATVTGPPQLGSPSGKAMRAYTNGDACIQYTSTGPVLFSGYFKIVALPVNPKKLTLVIVYTSTHNLLTVDVDYNGDMRLIDKAGTTVDTYAAGLAIDEWWFLEIRCDMVGLAQASVWMTDESDTETLVMQATSGFNHSGSDVTVSIQGGASPKAVDWWNYIVHDNVTADSDRLGYFGVLYIQARNLASAVPDGAPTSADNLSGKNWADMRAVPFSGGDSTNPYYSGFGKDGWVESADDVDHDNNGWNTGVVPDFTDAVACCWTMTGVCRVFGQTGQYVYGNDGGAASDYDNTTNAIPYQAKGYHGVRAWYDDPAGDAIIPGAGEKAVFGFEYDSFGNTYLKGMTLSFAWAPPAPSGRIMSSLADTGGLAGLGGLAGAGGGLAG